ncbi:7806_t:CDS:2, partial [Acaulospora morrowiae]
HSQVYQPLCANGLSVNKSVIVESTDLHRCYFYAFYPLWSHRAQTCFPIDLNENISIWEVTPAISK